MSCEKNLDVKVAAKLTFFPAHLCFLYAQSRIELQRNGAQCQRHKDGAYTDDRISLKVWAIKI